MRFSGIGHVKTRKLLSDKSLDSEIRGPYRVAHTKNDVPLSLKQSAVIGIVDERFVRSQNVLFNQASARLTICRSAASGELDAHSTPAYPPLRRCSGLLLEADTIADFLYRRPVKVYPQLS